PEACDLTTVEVIAAMVRRAAGFLCPCPARTLSRRVFETLDGLVSIGEPMQDEIESVIDALISYGDLIEGKDEIGAEAGSRAVVLFAAPPSFVLRRNGSVLLLGVAPDLNSALPETFEQRIEYLSLLGLIQLSSDSWMRAPSQVPSADLISEYNRKLASISGALSSAIILNPEGHVR